ncbi:MAG: MMPL family transporter [Methanomassiliicoccaceae archaeon]|jgi:predicted RND superfamily exporter protein|nr:MMPL family transporter [Methanomassiliicoccaceae archaeon]
MGLMSRMGEGVAKRPIVPFVILIIMTAAMAGVMVVSPPSFDMDEDSFRPDNDMMRAQTIISDSFSSTASVISLADARNAGGDIFSKDMFIQVLRYEMSLAEMQFTDVNGTDPDQYYSDLPMFRIISPVSAIAEGVVIALNITAVEMGDAVIELPKLSDFSGDHHGYIVAKYEKLIEVIEKLDTDYRTYKPESKLTDGPVATSIFLKGVAFTVLEYEPMLESLFTSDLKRLNMGDDGGLVSASGCMVYVMMMDSALEYIQDGEAGFEHDVMDVAKEFNGGNPGGLNIKAVGMESMMGEIGDMARNDIAQLLPIALIVMIVLLLIIYRDASDTLIALLGLVIAIIWTFGISSLAGVGMSTIAIAVPILILALGIDYSLHLVFRYREERSAGKSPAEAIATTMGSVGQALVLATVTTAIAFLSYLTSEMGALADFGLMCAIGIVCAFASMLLLIPTTQVLRDRRAEKKGKDPNEAKRYKRVEDESKDTLGKVAGVGGKLAAKSPWAVLGVIAVIVALCGYSATNLSYDFDMYDFIPEGTEAHDVITYLNDNYSTTTSTTSVLIFADPWDINTIRAIEDSLNNMADPQIRGIQYYSTTGPPDAEYLGTALMDLDKSLEDSLPESMMAYAPYHGAYIAAFDADGKLLPSATQSELDTLKDVVGIIGAGMALSSVVPAHGEDITRIILSMTTEIEGDNDAIVGMRDAVNAVCSPLADIGAEYVVTGQYVLMAATMIEMNKSQMTSLMITIILVILILTAVMYYTHRSFLLGAMATVPTLVSVIMVWGTMAAINMPLNVMTLTIASLAVGLGVTYGIHISNRYATEVKKNGLSAEEAIRKTMRETGKGVFAAAVTTVAGFGVMGFSKILPMYQFGIITALAIGFAYIGSIFVLPSLLVIWGRRASRKADAQDSPEDA